MVPTGVIFHGSCGSNGSRTFRFWIYGVLPDEEGNLDNRLIDPSLAQAGRRSGKIVVYLFFGISGKSNIWMSGKGIKNMVWIYYI